MSRSAFSFCNSVADELAGTPWITRLPFPVQVVDRVEVIDWIGRNRLVSRYAYHHQVRWLADWSVDLQ